MFGYVRPLRGELKVREFERFQSVYCGLCHTLERRYGPAARFLLNYDFTVLAVLLWPPDQPAECAGRRCAVHPLRKRCVCAGSPPLDAAADASMILAWRKLRDGAEDDPFFKALGERLLSWSFYPAYRKAAGRLPEFDRRTSACLRELRELEESRCDSIDRTADTFARILQSAAEEISDPARRRPMEELLYHLGRWIYLADAWDDLEEDGRSGNYNPIRRRFGLEGAQIPDQTVKTAVENTMLHSLNRMAAAFELTESGQWRELLENILYLGLPAVSRAVLDGNWRRGKRHESGGKGPEFPA